MFEDWTFASLAVQQVHSINSARHRNYLARNAYMVLKNQFCLTKLDVELMGNIVYIALERATQTMDIIQMLPPAQLLGVAHTDSLSHERFCIGSCYKVELLDQYISLS